MKRLPWLAPTLLLLAPAVARAKAPPPAAPTFEQHVRPLLKAYCLDCHGEGDKLRGGLDLRLRRLIVAGGDSGPGLVPGKRDDSPLFRRVKGGEMPPGKKKLSAAEVELIGRWVAAGAPAGPEPAKLGKGLHISAADRAHWSFQPVRRPAVPAPRTARARNPIDAFLLARLEGQGLSFSPEADRLTLLRRVTIDLTGLPPTLEEAEAFLRDAHPGAYERVVERLLASPRHGERWGRHWLDLAGYADSEGHTSEDPVRPHAYKYRDWVIRALNSDLPYDRFVTDQLAGDELVRPPYKALSGGALDRLIATGYLRQAPDGTASGGVDQVAARNQVVADTLQIVSTSLMGLTVHCAQCHNHRYDPIPQLDYYRLRAVFEPALDVKAWRVPAARRISLMSDADRARGAALEKEAGLIDAERVKKQQGHIERVFQAELKKLPEAVRASVREARAVPEARRSPAQKKLLQAHPSVNVSAGSLYLYDSKAAKELTKYAARAAAVRAKKPVEDFVRALTEPGGTPPVTHLFNRGDPTQPRQAVAPGGLTVLDGEHPFVVPTTPGEPTTGRRLALARWLTSPRHPLTARVIVNRLWLHHFGRGIVATPADFGALGDRPTHPELLDWLTAELVESGWSLKHVHRLMVQSAAYRQSARRTAELDRVDPDNRLLARMSLRRMEAETVRDSFLAVSGALFERCFGPPVPVKEDELGQVVLGYEDKDAAFYEKKVPALAPGEAHRRSVYVQVRRSKPLGVLEPLDVPVLEPSCEMRTASTSAPQALLLLNNAFVHEQARLFAEGVSREAGPSVRARVSLAWRRAYGEAPSPGELDEAAAFVAAQAGLLMAGGRPAPERAALAALCQALLSSNRFLYY
jgi:mono/diheme cytochrome c family protein